MFWNWIKRIALAIEKKHRQRHYKLIYSDTYGYGVQEALTHTVVRQWFLNHDDYIDYDDDE